MLKKIMASVAVGSILLAACGDDSTETTDDGDAAADETTESSATESSAASSDAPAADGECSVDNLPLHTAGMLTVATGEPVYQPWMADDDPSNGQGYESAVVYELADRLGFSADQVEWVRTTFDEAITPADKDYDFNIQQYSITPEREEIVDFSVPYYTADRVVMAMADSDAAAATSFSELRDVKWAATVGTNDLIYIEEVIGATDVAVFNNQADTQAAMLAGQADATVVNLPSGYYLTAAEIPDAVISGVLPEGGEGTEQLGLLFTDGNPLRECIDPVLEAMDADGTLDALSTEWLEGGGSIPTITED